MPGCASSDRPRRTRLRGTNSQRPLPWQPRAGSMPSLPRSAPWPRCIPGESAASTRSPQAVPVYLGDRRLRAAPAYLGDQRPRAAAAYPGALSAAASEEESATKPGTCSAAQRPRAAAAYPGALSAAASEEESATKPGTCSGDQRPRAAAASPGALSAAASEEESATKPGTCSEDQPPRAAAAYPVPQVGPATIAGWSGAPREHRRQRQRRAREPTSTQQR